MAQARQRVGFVEQHMVLSRLSHRPVPGTVGGVNASLHLAIVRRTMVSLGK